MHDSSAFALYEEKGRQEGREEGRREGLQEAWQEAVQEGRLDQAHRHLLRQGRQLFGEPDAATEDALRAIRDIDRLERLADAIFTAHSWQEFLATA